MISRRQCPCKRTSQLNTTAYKTTKDRKIKIYKNSKFIKTNDSDKEQNNLIHEPIENDDYDYGELADDESDEDASGKEVKVLFKLGEQNEQQQEIVYPTRINSELPHINDQVYLEDDDDDMGGGDDRCNQNLKSNPKQILHSESLKSIISEEKNVCPPGTSSAVAALKENKSDLINRRKMPQKSKIPIACGNKNIHNSQDMKGMKSVNNEVTATSRKDDNNTEGDRSGVRLEGGHNEFQYNNICMNEKNNQNNIESSFNDDSIVTSEQEFLSSPFSLSDLEGYIPPLTRTRRALIAQLAANQPDQNDPAHERKVKRKNRREAIRNFREMLIKRRKLKAYRRLKRVQDMHLRNPEKEACLLEKFELQDKKLNRPYYYEQNEPEKIKKLLRKRKNAINGKYRAYAINPQYRTKYKNRIHQDLQYAMQPPRFRIQKPAKKSVEEKVKLEEICTNVKDQDDRSSLYDTEIPESELEYFSSEWNDNGLMHPEPESRRRYKRKRLLNRYVASETDLPYHQNRKFLKRTEIEAQFKNHCQSRKAIKAMSRLKTVRMKKYNNPCIEADELKNLEIYDKKLDRDYLYDSTELPIYGALIEKRRRAIDRKYEKYARDKEFRRKYRDRIYVDVQRIVNSPYFDDDKEPESGLESESSFNDSEVPTSEGEYMSSGYEDLKPPVKFCKPITRNRKDLYDYLDRFEVKITDSENTIQYKRKLRMNAIQQFRKRLKDRRKLKAYNRLQDVKRMAVNDYGIIAGQLFSMEIIDKKLDRGYFYHRKEPKVFKILLKKRIRAIQRKFEQYMKDKDFRRRYEQRILKQWQEAKIPDYSNEMFKDNDDDDCQPFKKK